MTEEDKVSKWLGQAKTLTLLNVLIIFLLVATTVIPAYIVWKVFSDPSGKMLDRLLSTYEEIGNQQSGCTLRHAKQRGGPDFWSIGTGFAYSGIDRWSVNVVLERRPTDEEIQSYCATARLLAGDMLRRTGDSRGEDQIQP